MTGDQEILVSCEQDVSDLIRLGRNVKIIKLQIPNLSDKENGDYQKKLTRYHNECGCNTAAALSVLTISIYLMNLAILKMSTGALSFGWSSAAFVVLLFVVSAGVGKIIGILNAKIKYRDLVKNIKRHINSKGNNHGIFEMS